MLQVTIEFDVITDELPLIYACLMGDWVVQVALILMLKLMDPFLTRVNHGRPAFSLSAVASSLANSANNIGAMIDDELPLVTSIIVYYFLIGFFDRRTEY